MATYGFSERDFGRVSRVVQDAERQTRPGHKPDLGRGGLIAQPVSITFRNDADEAAPAFGIMRVTDADWTQSTGPYLICGKPDGTAGQYVVNDCVNVAAGKYGQCFVSGWVRVAYSGSQPANGDVLGPTSGKWTASASGTPGVILCSGFVSGEETCIARLVAANPLPLQLNNYMQIYEAGDGSPHDLTFGFYGYAITTSGTPEEAGCTLLETTAYDDPCIQLDRAGLWELTVNATGNLQLPDPTVDDLTLLTSANGVPSHSHSYAGMWPVFVPSVLAEYQCADESYANFLIVTVTNNGYRWAPYYSVLGSGIGNFGEGTKIRINFYQSLDSTQPTSFDVNIRCTLRWLGKSGGNVLD